MLFTEDNYKHMFTALQLAETAMYENEVPVGAVVVFNNKPIGKGYNQVNKLNDATAHAEMIAITSASNQLQTSILTECDLYVTLEPCIMCIGAALNSRIKNIYFSIFDPKFGACGSLYNLAVDGKYNHKINIFSGIYEDESRNLMKRFFHNLRNDKSNGSVN
jgi:tRNA(adenine34) deaminase